MVAVWHPLSAYLSPREQRRLFWILLPFSLLLLAILNALDHVSCYNDTAPFGTVSLTLSFNAQTAYNIINSWSPASQKKSAFGLGLDYLFMPLYSTCIGVACCYCAKWYVLADDDDQKDSHGFPTGASSTSADPWSKIIGICLAWLQWVAAVSDACENVCAIYMLAFADNTVAAMEQWALAVTIFSITKLVLTLFGLAYVGFTLTIIMCQRCGCQCCRGEDSVASESSPAANSYAL